jgi:hypothetical protein
MSEPEKKIEIPQKWCSLCKEWKAAIVLHEEDGKEVIELSREITFCPKCGAKLRDSDA